MDSKKQKAFGMDLAAAVGAVLLKHGMAGTKLMSKMSGNTLTIKIDLPAGASEPTKNAIERYKTFGAKLGLPKLGTMLLVAGKEYALVGLSTDGARVKAKQNVPGAVVVDLPLAEVQAAIASAGAKMVAQLDAAESSAPGDQIDPTVATLLGSIAKMGAPKPAEGAQ
jgi:hypothetical protein